MLKKKLCIIILLIFSIDVFSQSNQGTVLDIISGEVWVQKGKKIEKIKQRLGYKVNGDVTIFLRSDDAYVLGHKDKYPIFLTQQQYPLGAKIQEIIASSEGAEKMEKFKKDIVKFFDESEEYFGWLPPEFIPLFANDTILENSPLYPGRFMYKGEKYRGFNEENSILEWKLLAGHKGMVDWDMTNHEKPLKVTIEDIQKDKILFSKYLKPPLILNNDLIKDCHPCKLIIPKLEIEMIIHSEHFDTQEKQNAFNTLLNNKSKGKGLSLYQFLVIKMLINNGFYGNAVYYIEEYKETNEFVKEYIELIK
ncbi:hypothetical protein OAJ65_01605 [Flavobacteriales bacterium]|nr:hypothetical protein [Flavobacteriales bacterium]